MSEAVWKTEMYAGASHLPSAWYNLLFPSDPRRGSQGRDFTYLSGVVKDA
eukprot:m.286130 g.286130  ORF g.286130 m.286130 type:complete len:50 (-) comp17778_c0_seq9:373-522(-)